MKKACVAVTVYLYMDVHSEINLNDLVNELDYSFRDTTGSAVITDSHIEDFNIVGE
jgi:hypothetical protein